MPVFYENEMSEVRSLRLPWSDDEYCSSSSESEEEEEAVCICSSSKDEYEDKELLSNNPSLYDSQYTIDFHKQNKEIIHLSFYIVLLSLVLGAIVYLLFVRSLWHSHIRIPEKSLSFKIIQWFKQLSHHLRKCVY